MREAEKPILEFLERTQASLEGSKSLVERSGEGRDLLSADAFEVMVKVIDLLQEG